MSDVRAHFREALLRELFLTEPTVWRKRKVVQITPLDPYSYRQRTSYQFKVPSEILQAALQRALDEGGKNGFEGFSLSTFLENWPANVLDEEFEVVLPVTLLWKRVLLDFSITDMSDRPVVLLNRYDGSILSTKVIRWQLRGLRDARVDVFVNEHEAILRTICFLGFRDLVKQLRACGISEKVPDRGEIFYRKIAQFLHKSLDRFLYCQTKQTILEHQTLILKFHGLVRELVSRLRSVSAPNRGALDPVCNPVMGALDYAKLRLSEDYEKELLRDGDRISFHRTLLGEYLEQCLSFIRSLLQFGPIELKVIVGILNPFCYRYFAYAVVKIVPDREFLVKVEQVMPTRYETLYDKMLKWQYQVYPVDIGEARSVHVEIRSAVPSELIQVPKKTRVLVDGLRPLRPGIVFGYVADSTQFRQHFYTSKSIHELEETVSSSLGGHRRITVESVKLAIKYRVDRTLALTYAVGSGLVVLFTAYFFSTYGVSTASSASSTGRGTVGAAILPLILTVWVLLSRLRAQEIIVAHRLRWFVRIAMFCAVITTMWLVTVTWFPSVTKWISTLVTAVVVIVQDAFGRIF